MAGGMMHDSDRWAKKIQRKLNPLLAPVNRGLTTKQLAVDSTELSTPGADSERFQFFNLESSHFKSPAAYWMPSSKNLKSVGLT